MEIVREPLCGVPYCPCPDDPFAHRGCWVCGNTHGLDHHHTQGRGPRLTYRKDLVVLLCRGCHDRISLNTWSDAILALPSGPHYRVWDSHNTEIVCAPLPYTPVWDTTDNSSDLTGVSEVHTPAPNPSEVAAYAGSRVQQIQLTPVSLALPDMVTMDDWAVTFETYRRMHISVGWWLGDLAVYGDDRWPEAWQIIDASGIDRGTLANYMSCSRAWPVSLRSETMSWSAHWALAPLARSDPEAARKRLDGYEAEGCGAREIRDALAGSQRVSCVCPECGHEHRRVE